MNTHKSIEEFVEVEKTIDEEVNEIIDSLVADVHFEKTWPAHTAYYQIDLNQFQGKLKQALQSYAQQQVQEAVEIAEKMKDYPHCCESREGHACEYTQALDDLVSTLKSNQLTDNK